MPELPEVETARRLAEKALRGQRIVVVRTVPDTIVYEGVSGRKFAAALRDARVCNTGRKGKHFWLELDRRPWPTFHLGMTGSIHVYERAPDRPAYWKLELSMEDGTRLAMVNKRRLGRIRLRHDPLSEPPITRLGFDAFSELPLVPALRERLARRTSPIKALLLNQGFAAGIGNWIADELLYQSGISPFRLSHELTQEEVRRLRRAWKRVIGHAVTVEADDKRFPRTWLFHHRWGKKQDARTGRGEPIVFAEIGGRTTAWVPSVQH